jgi:hypothetical protein
MTQSVPLAVVAALTDTPMTLPDLVRSTGWSARAITEVMPDLLSIGAVVRDGNAYRRAPPAEETTTETATSSVAEEVPADGRARLIDWAKEILGNPMRREWFCPDWVCDAISAVFGFQVRSGISDRYAARLIIERTRPEERR